MVDGKDFFVFKNKITTFAEVEKQFSYERKFKSL